MANPTDRGRKLLVRTALATGVTVATLIGAQNLAIMDSARFAAATPTGDTQLILVPRTQQNVLTNDTLQQPTVVRNVAPNLVILRQSGSGSAAPVASPTAGQLVSGGITPPNPVALSAPDPVLVQQPGQVIVVQGGGSAAQPVQPVVTQSSR
ncbi:MAG: hypothetical protein JNL42_13585 [Anaerolineae bacterium]|nr:hypothetical protein [Anaerolineae bacterium]